MGFADDLAAFAKEIMTVAKDPSDSSLRALGARVAKSLGIEVGDEAPATEKATGTDPVPEKPPVVKLVK